MLINSSGLSKLKESINNSITEKIFLGHKPGPELIAILAVYLVQGALGLSRLSVSFFLKDELQLSPVEVSAILGIVTLPWMIKPLFGFVSDTFPIFGYRRRPYLILSGILGAASWIALATLVDSTWKATITVTLSSLAIAVSDVIVDSLVVERARLESHSKAGSLQSLCWGATALGSFLTAYFSGLVLEYFTTKTVFLITALFPLLISLVAWFITETSVYQEESQQDRSKSVSIRTQTQQLLQAFRARAVLLPTLFIFIWQCTPSGESAYFYFFTNELHFQPEFLGRIHLFTSLASLVGIWIFQRFLKNVPFQNIFTWSILISVLLRMTMLILITHTNRALGINDRWFSFGDSLIIAAMGQIAFMPTMILAARICPLGIEATLFAVLMSVFNLGGLVSRESGALIMYWLGITESNFDSLWLLLVITNLIALLPMLFVKLLPDKEEMEYGVAK
ncbi:folate/biopterin family MFS transporter [Cylindrospermopsis raciborskii S07]|uniref:Folate-biopterin transporter n=2 Tax=Cylindrospermopsis raciborskii TaxID=77022 RepID=A0A853MHZ2_9CYAN|nr:folate/biopterin family MFS transporter [Cylindrospermopsis raciborskii]EFA68559.1 Biopterin transport-related protein BT1 [Cylindrospermopsis raciborskii CS-505]OBU76728.1 folate-biopterin transporter [Cylindrospermopsis raciborskii CS-505]PNJ96281.1 folate/biopterin family MFS transporter [Cylindrospermopsis raciborskii C03]PNJ98129.1 folate/biopterin family MFS transporter [Cylindrospermopsis raciborskii C07]PNJ98347.1 folate/biopterin family MFS transporter [Cylindrospermopsis raciborsk